MKKTDERMLRAVAGALRSAIDAHGPIDKRSVGSAAKRVVGALSSASAFDGELSIYHNGEWLMGVNEPLSDAVLAAIKSVLPVNVDDPAQS